MRTVLLALLLLGCTSGKSFSPDAGPTNPLVAARPYQYQVPSGYTPSRPFPLVILLHGYGASGFLQDAYFGFSPFAASHGLLYAYPDGTLDSSNHRFWNATDACCDFGGTGVDDVAYVSAIIDDMNVRFNIDPKRIYILGHSNGGFMAHRLACDLSPRIAAIVSLAGDNWKDVTRCRPSQRVAVLQVHGDSDETIPYAGGGNLPNLPSAHESVAGWAQLNGCGVTAVSGGTLDVDTSLAGAETTVERWPNCTGGAAELWTIRGGTHLPALGASWPSLVYDFMAAHPKP
ncbi:MAG TPA: alpha/beta fold hydrolase [Polyangia bacterium]|jgi:polyhydroxybutyrate depolymerase|nr:alpha/beta fold hydrolase [Polyangia bacterium]